MSVRVLIVDDQEPFRSAARMVVELTDGFEVVGEAETGEASIDAARNLRPDLVLMDVNLPGIDGLDASAKIRAGEEPPVVFLVSTYDADVYASRIPASGAAAYLSKGTFAPDTLLEAWGQHGDA